jgi:hypothetical protein
MQSRMRILAGSHTRWLQSNQRNRGLEDSFSFGGSLDRSGKLHISHARRLPSHPIAVPRIEPELRLPAPSFRFAQKMSAWFA